MFLVAASRIESARGLPLSTQHPCAAYGPRLAAGVDVGDGAADDVEVGAVADEGV